MIINSSIYCSKCGLQINPDTLFCRKCGHKILSYYNREDCIELLNAGDYYKSQEDYDLAIETLIRALKIAKEKGYEELFEKIESNLMNIYFSISSIFSERKKYDDSIKVLNIALEVTEKYRLREKKDRIKSDLSKAYKKKAMSLQPNEYMDIIRNFDIAACFAEQVGDKDSLNEIKMNLSKIHYTLASIREREGSYEEAIKNYKIASKLSKEIGDNEIIININLKLAYAYYFNSNLQNEKGDKQNKISNLEKSLSLLLLYNRTEDENQINLIRQQLTALYGNAQEKNETFECYQCGATVKDDCIYCHKCGTKINLTMDDNEIIPEIRNYLSVEKIICKECGYENDADTNICLNCYAKIDGEPNKSVPFSKLNRREIEELYENFISKGEYYESNNLFDNALLAYQKAIITDDKNPKAYVKRAFIYVRKADFEKALKDLDAAIYSNPTDGNIYGIRADVYSIIDDYENALRDYTTAIEINHMDSKAYLGRALVYKKINRYDEALSDAKKAADLGVDISDLSLDNFFIE